MREIMIKAHKVAKRLRKGNYFEKLSRALKRVWKEIKLMDKERKEKEQKFVYQIRRNYFDTVIIKRIVLNKENDSYICKDIINEVTGQFAYMHIREKSFNKFKQQGGGFSTVGTDLNEIIKIHNHKCKLYNYDEEFLVDDNTKIIEMR